VAKQREESAKTYIRSTETYIHGPVLQNHSSPVIYYSD